MSKVIFGLLIILVIVLFFSPIWIVVFSALPFLTFGRKEKEETVYQKNKELLKWKDMSGFSRRWSFLHFVLRPPSVGGRTRSSPFKRGGKSNGEKRGKLKAFRERKTIF